MLPVSSTFCKSILHYIESQFTWFTLIIAGSSSVSSLQDYNVQLRHAVRPPSHTWSLCRRSCGLGNGREEDSNGTLTGVPISHWVSIISLHGVALSMMCLLQWDREDYWVRWPSLRSICGHNILPRRPIWGGTAGMPNCPNFNVLPWF